MLYSPFASFSSLIPFWWLSVTNSSYSDGCVELTLISCTEKHTWMFVKHSKGPASLYKGWANCGPASKYDISLIAFLHIYIWTTYFVCLATAKWIHLYLQSFCSRHQMDFWLWDLTLRVHHLQSRGVAHRWWELLLLQSPPFNLQSFIESDGTSFCSILSSRSAQSFQVG